MYNIEEMVRNIERYGDDDKYSNGYRIFFMGCSLRLHAMVPVGTNICVFM
jgi:hypothetical protein